MKACAVVLQYALPDSSWFKRRRVIDEMTEVQYWKFAARWVPTRLEASFAHPRDRAWRPSFQFGRASSWIWFFGRNFLSNMETNRSEMDFLAHGLGPIFVKPAQSFLLCNLGDHCSAGYRFGAARWVQREYQGDPPGVELVAQLFRVFYSIFVGPLSFRFDRGVELCVGSCGWQDYIFETVDLPKCFNNVHRVAGELGRH